MGGIPAETHNSSGRESAHQGLARSLERLAQLILVEDVAKYTAWHSRILSKSAMSVNTRSTSLARKSSLIPSPAGPKPTKRVPELLILQQQVVKMPGCGPEQVNSQLDSIMVTTTTLDKVLEFLVKHEGRARWGHERVIGQQSRGALHLFLHQDAWLLGEKIFPQGQGGQENSLGGR
eukprot:g47282.t1